MIGLTKYWIDLVIAQFTPDFYLLVPRRLWLGTFAIKLPPPQYFASNKAASPARRREDPVRLAKVVQLVEMLEDLFFSRVSWKALNKNSVV